MPGDKDYSGTPLPAKLGIKPGGRIALIGAPEGFSRTLGPLPEGVEVRTDARGRLDVAVLFVTTRAELAKRFPPLARAVFPGGGVWVAWPKKASKLPTDLTFEIVQRLGLDARLVDNKSASIDAAYQGLRFVYRLTDRR